MRLQQICKEGEGMFEEVNREIVERVAYIVGPLSAAARAIHEADTYEGDVKFYQTSNSFIVAKIPHQPIPTTNPIPPITKVKTDDWNLEHNPKRGYC